MYSILADFMIFLHGPSGAGKGELYRQLHEVFRRHGYEVVYVSSGELFRAVYDDPVIAEQLRLGYYLDTLQPIMPRVQVSYEQFVRSWAETHGQTVFILDGLVRRTAFVNKHGRRIPSQVRQVASAFYDANLRLGGIGGPFMDKILASEDTKASRPRSIAAIASSIKRSHHILVDTAPEDAEAQIQIRVGADLNTIQERLEVLESSATMTVEKAQAIRKLVETLSQCIQVTPGTQVRRAHTAQLAGAIVRPGGELSDEQITATVGKLRVALCQLAGVGDSASFAASFNALGIATNIRDEDISPQSRRARVSNYVQVRNTGQTRTYVLGFAAEALIKEFGFMFQSHEANAAFRVREGAAHPRSRVIVNGASRGIGLDLFKSSCDRTAEQVLKKSDHRRAKLSAAIERHSY